MNLNGVLINSLLYNNYAPMINAFENHCLSISHSGNGPAIAAVLYKDNVENLVNSMEKFDGKIPMTVDELMQLPGVGRKTANVITSVIDKQPNMAVDTHVFRVSKRIGLVTQTAKTPHTVEKELVKNIPERLIHKAHHWLILHGRYTCLARNPKCIECGIRPVCRYYTGEKLNKQG
jgi:endonuclease III